MRYRNLKGSRRLTAEVIEVPRASLQPRQQQVTVQVAKIFLKLFIKYFESMPNQFDIMLLHDWVPFRCQLVLLRDSDFVERLRLVVDDLEAGVQELAISREVDELKRTHACIFDE